MDEEDGLQEVASPPHMENANAPLCVFYYTHPWNVENPEDDFVDSYGDFRRPVTQPIETESWRRVKTDDAERRREKRTPNRSIGRRYLREPPRHLNTYLLAGRQGNRVIDLDVVINTVREAWAPHRSNSLDRALDQPAHEMGTGGRSSLQTNRGRPLLAGLPHRRYSVPETIMRKYTLTKQNSESNSDSGAKTVPTMTPPTMATSPKKLSNASDRDKSANGGGRTPPGDRRRKTGRRMFDDGYKKSTKGPFKVRKGPPMYRGNHGNLDPISDSAESDFITQEDVIMSVGEKTFGTSSSEEIKSPDCAECKAFLRDVVAEEAETSGEKSPQKLLTSDVNENVIQESAIEVPLENNNTQEIEDEPAEPDSKLSEGSNPLDEQSDRTSPKFIIPRIKPVLSKSPAFKSVSAGNSEEADNANNTPPNSERSKSTSIEQVSDLSTPSPYEYQSSGDSGAANHNYSTLSPDTEASTSEKTSGYSELSSLENTSPAGPAESSPEQECVPRLDLGPASSSETPVISTPPTGGSGQGSGDATGSSPSPREPRSDRSSTQDSTLSLLSESTPSSKAFSMLSSVSTPIFTTPVLTIATQTKETQYELEDAQFESIATNTDSPVLMETTSTNTELFEDDIANANHQDDGKTDAGNLQVEETVEEKLQNELDKVDLEGNAAGQAMEEEVFTDKFEDGDLGGVVDDVNPMSPTAFDSDPKVDDNVEETFDDVISDKDRDSISPSNRSDSLNSLDGDKANKANDESTKAANKIAEMMSSQTPPITRHFSMSRSTEEKYAKEAQPPPSQASDVSSRELMVSPESQSALDKDVYSFANRFDEDEYIKLTHQRQRFWMSRKPSEIALPSTPSHGALSCVGAGTIYRRNNFDVQLVVPRYSALPRSISMLVNTSSADCSSNSSDSECLSLVDSLDEVVTKSPTHFRSEDVIRLLPVESGVDVGGDKQLVNVATPRGKAKAFFVPMDEPISMTEQVPLVSAVMPDKLKEKLYRRQKVIDLKRQQKAESQEIKEKELQAKVAKERKTSKAKAGKSDKKSPREKTKKVRTPRKGEKGDGDGDSPRSTTKDEAPVSGKENFAKPKKKDSELKESDQDKQRDDTQELTKPTLPTKLSQKSSIPIKKGSDPLKTSPRGGASSKPSQLPIRRRHVSPPIRRSANLLGRFQQRFEVIPEEKSGSMESSEETGRHSRNKLPAKDRGPGKDVSPTSTLARAKREAEPKAHKRIPRPTRTLRPSKANQGPVIENIVIREIEDDPKDPYQGKAALAPHTDEGMSALSKGWINFYLLRGLSSPENMSDEALLTLSDKERQRRRSQNSAPLKTVNVVGGNGNRIRTYTVPYHEPRTLPSIPTLPEIKSDTSSRKQSLKSAERPAGASPDGSKITAVLHLPSPRVPPPYLFDGSEEQMSSETSSVTSSDSESERTASPALLPVRWPIRQPQRRLPPHRSKSQHGREHPQYPRQSSANVGVGWTVTVASSNSQHTPDLEMRLSFPSSAKRPPNSQSDSGLGEDNNNNTNKGGGKEQRDERARKPSHFLPAAAPVQQTQRWTLTVKNGGLERMQDNRADKRLLQSLPELENQQGPGQLNTKKPIKRDSYPSSMNGDSYTKETRQISAIWPNNTETFVESKVIIRKTTARYSRDVRSISQLFNDAEEEMVRRAGLAVTGLAIMPERKPRVPTMSERDLTRGLTPKRY